MLCSHMDIVNISTYLQVYKLIKLNTLTKSNVGIHITKT